MSSSSDASSVIFDPTRPPPLNYTIKCNRREFSIIVFFTLNIANNMLTEAVLSYLGAGVQPPSSSWGTMISEGFEALYNQPLLTIIPDTAILLTVLSVNIFGDGLRDALDPRRVI